MAYCLLFNRRITLQKSSVSDAFMTNHSTALCIFLNHHKTLIMHDKATTTSTITSFILMICTTVSNQRLNVSKMHLSLSLHRKIWKWLCLSLISLLNGVCVFSDARSLTPANKFSYIYTIFYDPNKCVHNALNICCVLMPLKIMLMTMSQNGCRIRIEWTIEHIKVIDIFVTAR